MHWWTVGKRKNCLLSHYMVITAIIFLPYSIDITVPVTVTIKATSTLLLICLSHYECLHLWWINWSLVHEDFSSHVAWVMSIVFFTISNYQFISPPSYSCSSFPAQEVSLSLETSHPSPFFFHWWQYYNLIVFHLVLFTKNALMTGLWKIQINNMTLFSQRQPGLHMCQIEYNR